MAKTPRRGNVLFLELNSVDASCAVRSFEDGKSEITTDATSGNDPLESQFFIRDTVAPTGTFLVLDDALGILIRAELEQGREYNLIWGPEGNAAGKPKWGIEARVNTDGPTYEHDTEQVLNVEWTNRGADWLFDGRSDTF